MGTKSHRATQRTSHAADADTKTAPPAPTVTVGRIVHYTLNEHDAGHANRRRVAQTSSPAWIPGAQAHVGNLANEGDTLPLLVTRVNDNGSINGQVFLDGNDVLWVTSVHEGDEPGTWSWPPRV